jgi:hypothetical protein
VASRWRAIWDWFQEKSPAGIVNDWDISASKATSWCVSCWWKRLRSRCAATGNGGASISIWRLGEEEKSPRLISTVIPIPSANPRVCLLTENARQEHTYLIAEKSPLRHSFQVRFPPGRSLVV